MEPEDKPRLVDERPPSVPAAPALRRAKPRETPKAMTDSAATAHARMTKVDSLVLARLHAAVAKRVQQQQPSSNKQHSGQPDDILTEIDKHSINYDGGGSSQP